MSAFDTAPHVRPAQAGDDDFILSLAERYAAFDLPHWRKRSEVLDGIRRDIDWHLTNLPASSHLFVAADDADTPLGFLHLQTRRDFFTGAQNCHLADLAVAAEHEGRGVASALLRFAGDWAKEHRCRHLTLGVFPNNARARALYERHGFGVELLHMVKPIR